MLIMDGTDRVIRLNGVVRHRVGPASFMAGGGLSNLARNIMDAANAVLASQGYHIALVIRSRVPLDYTLWIGPLDQEPQDGWDD